MVDDNGVETDYGKQTAESMSKYSDNNKVIYIRHTVNKNGSAARNTGIRASKGEYLAFLDDDDVYLPERLHKMVEKMDNLPDDYGACYTAYIKRMSNGKTQRSKNNAEGDVYVRALMRSFSIGSGSNLFYRKKAVEDIGLFDESFLRNQDLEYNLRILSKYKVAFVDEVLMEIYFDSRTVSFTYEQNLERETRFRETFKNRLDLLNEKDRRNVLAMYDIDWTRYLVSSKMYKKAIINIIKSKIPISTWIKYILYLLDRYIHNTSYSFVPNIK